MTATPTESSAVDPTAPPRPPKVRQRAAATSMFDPAIVRRAIVDSFVKLDPRQMARNPVMFVVEIGSVLTTILFFHEAPSASASNSVGSSASWPRGCGSRCSSPTSPRPSPRARQGAGRHAAQDPVRDGRDSVQQGDWPLTSKASGSNWRSATSASFPPGQIIPGDGDVVEGIASVDESAITGESAPVIRESGGDRSAVPAGRCALRSDHRAQSPRSRARPSSTA